MRLEPVLLTRDLIKWRRKPEMLSRETSKIPTISEVARIEKIATISSSFPGRGSFVGGPLGSSRWRSSLGLVGQVRQLDDGLG